MTPSRDKLTIAERCEDLRMTIDPGFVHRRKIQTVLGQPGMQIIDELIAKLPPMPDGLLEARIDGIYTNVFLQACGQLGVPPLLEVLAKRNCALFCSVETFGPCPELWDGIPRASNAWIPPEGLKQSARLEYSTDKLRSDTTKSRLATGHAMAIVGEITQATEDSVVIEPIVIGGPWIPDDGASFDTMWWAYDYFENFIEDVDEFSRVREVDTPKDCAIMKGISENAFKQCLASIIGGDTPKDWGGETSDFYSSHLHLNGRRTTGAFLLKGPARFAPMSLAHLGKNNDQIVRLASEPAQLLIVQHSHEILSAVRATLRAFAVQPCRPRRFCLIDGRDSLRLLQAYDLVDHALELSK